jgi:hypothetical protein
MGSTVDRWWPVSPTIVTELVPSIAVRRPCGGTRPACSTPVSGRSYPSLNLLDKPAIRRSQQQANGSGRR